MSERSVYLIIKEPAFLKQKEVARKAAVQIDEEFAKDGSLLWENISLVDEHSNTGYELDENKNTLNVWGDFSNGLGFVSLTLSLDIDLVIDIIQLYVKKMNKIKAMLEATK